MPKEGNSLGGGLSDQYGYHCPLLQGDRNIQARRWNDAEIFKGQEAARAQQTHHQSKAQPRRATTYWCLIPNQWFLEVASGTFQHAYCAWLPTHELVFAPGGSLADMREEDDSHHQHIRLQKEIKQVRVFPWKWELLTPEVWLHSSATDGGTAGATKENAENCPLWKRTVYKGLISKGRTIINKKCIPVVYFLRI